MSSLLVWLAFQLMMVGDASKSQTILSFAYPKGSYSDEYVYISMVNRWNLGDVETAKQLAEKLLESFSSPVRYQGVAFAIKNEIEARDETKKDLNEIKDEMRAVQHKLRNAYGGKETQARQKRIVVMLDRMIKQKEDQAQVKSEKKESAHQMKKPAAGQGSSPQDDSRVDNTGGPGRIDPRKVAELTKNWGSLPPREREANMRELTRKLPQRYRELILTYFRKLSEESDK